MINRDERRTTDFSNRTNEERKRVADFVAGRNRLDYSFNSLDSWLKHVPYSENPTTLAPIFRLKTLLNEPVPSYAKRMMVLRIMVRSPFLEFDVKRLRPVIFSHNVEQPFPRNQTMLKLRYRTSGGGPMGVPCHARLDFAGGNFLTRVRSSATLMDWAF